ncbi:peptidase [Confluentibacter flavum]|uniref:Peptidase n=1 Tax=Confluentibacter flavum TaxID=1909700 RepID=A0A2N3HFM4_9FLAO|nr:peptidase [Confluentibacter flavum]PKQ43703.1 peptidase [Confluentibacter flavum]
MTYCLGIKTKEGLVAIADTRITSGTNKSTKKKIYVQQREKHSLFIMTSGLRSVRDKAVLYFEELFHEGTINHNKMYKAVNAFGEQVKRVAAEDEQALEKAGLKFNLNTIIGGQLENDEEHKLFLIYSQGNWVEVNDDSPFVIIGNSGYGKTLLNRVLNSDFTVKQALKAGFLSFDSTRLSSNDVGFPIDVVIYEKDTYHMSENRYTSGDMKEMSQLWDTKLKQVLNELPEDWMKDSVSKIINKS